jgi:hypothetical protein
MATRKKKTTDPSGVVKGSHLTVITFSDGTTKLEWDDDALLRDVQEAIASVETKALKAKTKRKSKGRAQRMSTGQRSY